MRKKVITIQLTPSIVEAVIKYAEEKEIPIQKAYDILLHFALENI